MSPLPAQSMSLRSNRLLAPICRSGLVLAICGWAAHARADGVDYHESVPPPPVARGFTVPFELGNAAAWTKGRRGPAYQFRVGLLPGLVVRDRLSLHLVLQGVYRNPRWDVGVGVRPVFQLTSILNGVVPISVLGEGSYLPITRGGYAGGGLMLGLGRLMYLAVLGGYEVDRHTTFVGVRIGSDLLAWGDPVGAVIHDVPQTGAPPP
ncbi:MAG TPA: hypothetical protein VEQ59_16780 [Polyangiaceae bacterium]|nr:hypothetical protein [Polyangiaceae bacterium]